MIGELVIDVEFKRFQSAWGLVKQVFGSRSVAQSLLQIRWICGWPQAVKSTIKPSDEWHDLDLLAGGEKIQGRSSALIVAVVTRCRAPG